MRVTFRHIDNGLRGTKQTLVHLFRAIEDGQANPVVARFTRDAIGRTDFRREKRLVKRIARAWIRRVQILEDPVRHEWVQSAERTLMERRGDCDDLVVALGSSFEHIGFTVELVVGSQSPRAEQDFSHVWIRTWLPRAQTWLPVDPRGMAQFGWPVGRELGRSKLSAVRAYGWDEERRMLVPGSSLGAARLAGLRAFAIPGEAIPSVIDARPLPTASGTTAPPAAAEETASVAQRLQPWALGLSIASSLSRLFRGG